MIIDQSQCKVIIETVVIHDRKQGTITDLDWDISYKYDQGGLIHTRMNVVETQVHGRFWNVVNTTSSIYKMLTHPDIFYLVKVPARQSELFA